MAYSSFRANCIFRSILLCSTACLLFFLLFSTTLYATTALVGIVLAVQVYLLIIFVERTNRDLTRFLKSIECSDFSQSFHSGVRGPSFDELNRAFTNVFERFREINLEKEEHFRYLQTVVRHVGVGIIAFTREGSVQLINNAAKRLFDIPHLTTIDDLERISPALRARISRIEPGQRDLITVYRHDELMQLSVHATELRLRRSIITLISIQNIHVELSEKELEAWQNLIRVLTHEIRNSLTPISSLVSTIEGLLESGETADGEAIGDIREALRTIKSRSHGLLRFVDAYRNLTHIQKPEFKTIGVADLFNRVERLILDQIKQQGISYTRRIDPETLEMTADPNLIEQVMINIIINAAQALSGRADARIETEACIDERSRLLIRVTDNGPGIVEEALDKIFVPFYSTKKGGSGVGLSLSRQIMRLHRGDLTVRSIPEKQTIFTLRF